jgi:23S rRNA pseudouridine1911/1915/1917 synthase
VEITINKSLTLIEFLIEQYPDSPRTRIKKNLQSGDIRINNKSVTLHSYPLNPGDKVEIITQSGIKVKTGGLPFPVLYEDQHVIVIDKPAGTATSSVDGSTSIYEILNEYLKKLSKGTIRSYVVHRLDKEVSGVLLFAKSQVAMDTIKERWKETDKHYYALVEGIPAKPEDTITSWLIEDNRQKVLSVPESPESKYAVTHYKTLQLLNTNALLDVKTETGRKNQIRVHLSDIGCPIVGDRKYGASAEFIRRIRLHAYHLTFPHPAYNKMITVESQMPQGFLTLKAKDEKYK